MNFQKQDLRSLLSCLKPTLNPGHYVYAKCSRAELKDIDDVLASFKEPEGYTVILNENNAKKYELEYTFRCCWITLGVYSDLGSTGLTAAVSKVLTNEGIPCNIVAAFHHDHLFVPADQAKEAMKVLENLVTG